MSAAMLAALSGMLPVYERAGGRNNKALSIYRSKE